MSKIILKTLSAIGIVFLIVVLFGFGQMPLIEGKHFFNKYIDTEFAENYTPEKFEQIKTGMQLEDIIGLIGKPLQKKKNHKDGTYIKYYYTSDGKLLHDAKKKGRSDYGDFAWYRSAITLNSENIVVAIDKGWSYD